MVMVIMIAVIPLTTGGEICETFVIFLNFVVEHRWGTSHHQAINFCSCGVAVVDAAATPQLQKWIA